MPYVVTYEEVAAAGKSVAAWLEGLPEDAKLMHPQNEAVVLIDSPRYTASLLRLLLPPEGQA